MKPHWVWQRLGCLKRAHHGEAHKEGGQGSKNKVAFKLTSEGNRGSGTKLQVQLIFQEAEWTRDNWSPASSDSSAGEGSRVIPNVVFRLD